MKQFPYRKYLPLIAAALMLAAVAASPLGIHADFGDFAGDNDYGGGGDWGGGDSDWGSGGSSSSSSSDDDGGFLLWIFFELFEVVYKNFGLPGVIVLILILVGIYLLFKRRKGHTPQMQQTHTPAPQQDAHSDLRPMSAYHQLDPAFDEAAFREKISNLYVQFQNAWTDKKMDSLRPYLTDAMFAQFDRQLEAYRRNNQTNYVDRIAVLGTDLLGWKQESVKDVIVVKLRTRIVDYVKDDTTGALVRGSMTQEKFMTYEWTLVRTSGQTTSNSVGLTGQTCPYCGAHIDINHTAVCEYCGSVLTTDTFDWAVSNIRGVSQRTGH